MRARKDTLSGQAELFRARLENLIDHSHELVTLAERIDWAMFESKFGAQFAEGVGRPALPTRLMVAQTENFDQTGTSPSRRGVAPIPIQ